MNDKIDKYMQRATEALAFLHIKVKAVLQAAPTLLEIDDLHELPEAKAKNVEAQLWDIFAYGEYYVEKVMSDLCTMSGLDIPMLSVKSKRLFDFYKNQYQPLITKTRGLIDVQYALTRMRVEIETVRMIRGLGKTESEADNAGASEADNAGAHVLQSDINNHMPTYMHFAKNGLVRDWLLMNLEHRKSSEETDLELRNLQPLALGPFVATIHDDEGFKRPLDFESAFSYLKEIAREFLEDQHGTRVDDDDDEHRARNNHLAGLMSIFDNLLRKDYFVPAYWEENEKELFPVIVTHPIQNIPKHVKKRMQEIYRSFIFGNWMSVLALSRCLLEYALIHRKSLLEQRSGREIEVRDATTGWTKKIGDLASIAAEAFPELDESMKIVIEYGNYVMHPYHKTIPSKNMAKHGIDEISKIIETLYGT